MKKTQELLKIHRMIFFTGFIMAQNCPLCDLPLSDRETRIIKEISLKNCVKASLQRKDNKHTLLRKYKSLEVHEVCSKNYVSQRKIEFFLRKKEGGNNSDNVRTRSTQLDFDWENLCFICSEDASDEFIKKEKKKSENKRVAVSIVNSNDCRNTLLTHTEKSSTLMSIALRTRLLSIENVVAVGARYHHKCYKIVSKTTARTSYSEDSFALKAATFIAEKILANESECQFSINTLLAEFNEDKWPTWKYIKNHLIKIFGDQIVIHNSKKGPIVTLRSASEQILSNNFYKTRVQDEKEERKRIVIEASKIILDDIQSTAYEIDSYPSPDEFLNNINSDIPETLQIMLDTIIGNRKRDTSKYSVKQTAIAHAIISSTRPRSFISTLLLGLTVMLNKKFGSKELINILDSLGFCASYRDLQLFNASLLQNPQEEIIDESFLQFVYDNADNNINTLDGRNTFHSMGGIQIATPLSLVKSKDEIEKLKSIPSAMDIGQHGHVDLEYFEKPRHSGLKSIIVEDLNTLNSLDMNATISHDDFLWICGRKVHPNYFIGWHGFMEEITKDLDYSRSKITFLPFVNAPASNYDTIYTVAIYSSKKAQARGQKHVPVSFDQPLYFKFREILASCPELSNLIPRIGGFHLSMSYMGGIGFTMDGSGLQEALCELYAENSVDKIIKGHAYARSVRAHILIQLALSQHILSSFEMDDKEAEMIDEILACDNQILNELHSDGFQKLYTRYKEHIENLRNNGPTAKLWMQYYDMVNNI